MTTTEDLVSELAESENAEAFLKKHRKDLHRQTLAEYLQSLMRERQIKVSDLAVSANFGDYLYKVCNGKRHPSRDALLAIAAGMKLTREEAGFAMRLAGYSEPDIRDARDAVVLHGLQRRAGLDAINGALYELGMETLSSKV
ncbi:MAG: hypothetical protein K5982_03955 [Selenomonadaceae bacterium]|nr:hypothetical protein [Selenomonadaceae bacterium]